MKCASLDEQPRKLNNVVRISTHGRENTAQKQDKSLLEKKNSNLYHIGSWLESSLESEDFFSNVCLINLVPMKV